MTDQKTRIDRLGDVRGRDAIAGAYREAERAEDYLRSRYESDPFGRATHRSQVRALTRVLRRLKPATVLEVATGPARLTVHVPRVTTGIGLEQSPAMIRIAEERLRRYGRVDWKIVRGDAFALPFRREFDVAMCFKLIRHFAPDARMQLMKGLMGVVKEGGYVIFDVANAKATSWLHRKWGVEDVWIDDYWFSKSAARVELLEAGFVGVDFHQVQPCVSLQHLCWSRVWPRSQRVAERIGEALELCRAGEPLEWIVVCRCG